jgi:hypothetical protein
MSREIRAIATVRTKQRISRGNYQQGANENYGQSRHRRQYTSRGYLPSAGTTPVLPTTIVGARLVYRLNGAHQRAIWRYLKSRAPQDLAALTGDDRRRHVFRQPLERQMILFQ